MAEGQVHNFSFETKRSIVKIFNCMSFLLLYLTIALTSKLGTRLARSGVGVSEPLLLTECSGHKNWSDESMEMAH